MRNVSFKETSEGIQFAPECKISFPGGGAVEIGS